MGTLERLKELYDRDFPIDATEENNAEYKQFIEDLLLVFPQLVAVVEAHDKYWKTRSDRDGVALFEARRALDES